MYRKLACLTVLAVGYMGWFVPASGQAENAKKQQQGSQQALSPEEREWRDGITAAQRERKKALHNLRTLYDMHARIEKRLRNVQLDQSEYSRRMSQQSSEDQGCYPGSQRFYEDMTLQRRRYEGELEDDKAHAQDQYRNAVTDVIELMREHIQRGRQHVTSFCVLSSSWRLDAFTKAEKILFDIDASTNGWWRSHVDPSSVENASRYLCLAEAKDWQEAMALEKSLGLSLWNERSVSADSARHWWLAGQYLAVGACTVGGIYAICEMGPIVQKKIKAWWYGKKKSEKAKAQAVVLDVSENEADTGDSGDQGECVEA